MPKDILEDTRDVTDVSTDPAAVATGKTAVLYRMALPDHLCPSGQKARWLLERKEYDVDDRVFRTRPEVDAFKDKHDVPTTPQIWIEGERVGGYQALRERLTDYDPKATTYKPVIYLFAVAAATALTLSIGFLGTITWQTLGWFISISMVLLGLQKLKDIEGFSTMFLNYDLLAKRWVRYGYVYPWVETGAGLLMTAMVWHWLSVPSALFIGTVGAVSVFKAVYVDKRELKCACVGGGSNVPLGFVSLTENLMMMGMAVVMLWRLIA
jgi:glutaredoxin